MTIELWVLVALSPIITFLNCRFGQYVILTGQLMFDHLKEIQNEENNWYEQNTLKKATFGTLF